MPTFLLNKLASGYPLALLAKIKKQKLGIIYCFIFLFEISVLFISSSAIIRTLFVAYHENRPKKYIEKN